MINMTKAMQQLQGCWFVAALEVDGRAMETSGATISVDGDHFTTSGMGAEYSGRLAIEGKSLTMHFESGPEAGNANHGIYEFKGEQWRLCLSMSGGPAPKTFETTPGSGFALETLVRAKPLVVPKAAEIDESTREPVPKLQGEWAMISCVRGGDPLPPVMLPSAKRTITGVKSTLHFGKQLFMQGLLSRDGVHIKLEHTGGDLRGKTQLGIYELAGNTLKTCFGPAGGARPTEYASSAAGGETYAVWKRIR